MPIDYTVLEPHAFYGAVAGAVLSLYLLLQSPGLGIALVFAILVGIAVDLAAHQYQH